MHAPDRLSARFVLPLACRGLSDSRATRLLAGPPTEGTMVRVDRCGTCRVSKFLSWYPYLQLQLRLCRCCFFVRATAADRHGLADDGRAGSAYDGPRNDSPRNGGRFGGQLHRAGEALLPAVAVAVASAPTTAAPARARFQCVPAEAAIVAAAATATTTSRIARLPLRQEHGAVNV